MYAIEAMQLLQSWCFFDSSFDNASLDKIIERVADLPDPQLKEAFDVAYGNIHAFHFPQKALLVKLKKTKVS
ncbi:hypothetical protein MKX03_003455 [Papaver bracteatum]|nr:hypothetical protein MKX03_003455 [Papaver bracteatum]